MGSGRWTPDDWKDYSTSHIKGKSTKEIFNAGGLDKDLDPKGVNLRESCDSKDNPESNAIIVALDVTGSMAPVLDSVAREGLKTLAEEIYNRKPVTDPHIMFMGVGDVTSDRVPFQITQFEADIRIIEQLQKIYLEENGGSNNSESYILPWWWAATHTKLDSFEKRGKKGFLFTIGDEEPTPFLTKEQIKKFIGETPQFEKITPEECLDLVSKQYEVFHLIIEKGHYYRKHPEKTLQAWRELLGQRAILVSDHTKIGEIIISTIQVVSGEKVDSVINSWDGTTALVVKKAIQDLSEIGGDKKGVVRFQ